MKYWKKMLDMWKPLQTDELVATDDLEFFETEDESVDAIMEAFLAGFDAAVDMVVRDTSDVLEGQLRDTKMRKKYRHGFLDAAEAIYQVFDRYAEGDVQVKRGKKPLYWKAQMSYGVHDDYSVVKEWDSFGSER